MTSCSIFATKKATSSDFLLQINHRVALQEADIAQGTAVWYIGLSWGFQRYSTVITVEYIY